MANMILGMIMLNKRYTPLKYLSVLMISAGIATCTIMSAKDVKGKDTDAEDEPEGDDWEMFHWLTGISMLTFALFLSARMGIYQEVIYKRYGKHPKEALFYSHCLPLPGFIFLAANIAEHWSIAVNSSPLQVASVAGVQVEAPKMLIYLLGNVLTQYACISAVFVLTSECARYEIRPYIKSYYRSLFQLNRNLGGHPAQVPLPPLLYLVLSQPLYSLALDRHRAGLLRHSALFQRTRHAGRGAQGKTEGRKTKGRMKL